MEDKLSKKIQERIQALNDGYVIRIIANALNLADDDLTGINLDIIKGSSRPLDESTGTTLIQAIDNLGAGTGSLNLNLGNTQAEQDDRLERTQKEINTLKEIYAIRLLAAALNLTDDDLTKINSDIIKQAKQSLDTSKIAELTKEIQRLVAQTIELEKEKEKLKAEKTEIKNKNRNFSEELMGSTSAFMALKKENEELNNKLSAVYGVNQAPLQQLAASLIDLLGQAIFIVILIAIAISISLSQYGIIPIGIALILVSLVVVSASRAILQGQPARMPTPNSELNMLPSVPQSPPPSGPNNQSQATPSSSNAPSLNPSNQPKPTPLAGLRDLLGKILNFFKNLFMRKSASSSGQNTLSPTPQDSPPPPDPNSQPQTLNNDSSDTPPSDPNNQPQTHE